METLTDEAKEKIRKKLVRRGVLLLMLGIILAFSLLIFYGTAIVGLGFGVLNDSTFRINFAVINFCNLIIGIFEFLIFIKIRRFVSNHKILAYVLFVFSLINIIISIPITITVLEKYL